MRVGMQDTQEMTYANNLNEFRQRIQDKAASCKTNCRVESWNFWMYRLYGWLHNHGNGVVDALWDSIVTKRADPDAAESLRNIARRLRGRTHVTY